VTLCIIGCGNSTRSDDGVGVYIAQRLRRVLALAPQPGVQVFDAGTGGMDVMFQARGARRLLLVDAARSGAEAGAIFRVPGEELASVPDAGFSLHDFRWQHALTAGRKLFGVDFPRDVTVYLIEAESLAFGLALSAVVARAAERVIDEIREILSSVADRGPLAGISVAGGNLYLSQEICARYFAHVDAVALLARDDEVLILPLTRESAGGLLLKQRNARGDRVIHAQEFFRRHELPEQGESRTLPGCWSPAQAALVLRGLMARKAAAEPLQNPSTVR
jgi:hydrogenase maturation protease